MTMTKFVTENEFDETVKEGFWIADFYTDHCGPCKMLDMIFADIIFDNPQINLAKCDIEKSPEFSTRFDIEGTPTVFFMTDGEIKERIVGARPRAELEEIISSVMFGD